MDNSQIDPARLLKLAEAASGISQEQLGTIINLNADVALLRGMVKEAQSNIAVLTTKLTEANATIEQLEADASATSTQENK